MLSASCSRLACVSVGDAKALADHLARLFCDDALALRLGRTTCEAFRSANSHAGKVAWADGLL